jgi:hypothetical protein
MENGLIQTALDIQEFLQELDQPFAFIGGVALQRWGEPRVTRDVDLTILTRFEGESQLVKMFLARFPGRISDAESFALENRVILAKHPSGVAIDASLGGLPFEESAIERSTFSEYIPGVHLRTVSASDLVILKAFASRPRDWDDIRGIFVRSGSTLDISYIESHLIPLVELKEEPEILDRLREFYSIVGIAEG